VAGKLYDKACNLNFLDGCNGVGVAHENGWGRPKNAARAIPFYRKACDGKIWLGCKNLAVMYERGRGTAVDSYRAHRYYFAWVWTRV
jgi:TPR repeat protein